MYVLLWPRDAFYRAIIPNSGNCQQMHVNFNVSLLLNLQGISKPLTRGRDKMVYLWDSGKV